MRLWHKDLIHYLPRQQLISQWRECCAIAGKIKKCGSPQHLLVNKIMKYPLQHFVDYTELVIQEMKNRGYNISDYSLNKFRENTWLVPPQNIDTLYYIALFYDWHNIFYLRQCYYNLEEKWMCGGISDEEWKIIYDKFHETV